MKVGAETRIKSERNNLDKRRTDGWRNRESMFLNIANFTHDFNFAQLSILYGGRKSTNMMDMSLYKRPIY